MNIKLDENMPTTLVDSLVLLGHDVDTVPSEGLTGRDDDSVWQATQNARRFLITQDLDFSTFADSPRGPIKGFCWFACAAPAGSH